MEAGETHTIEFKSSIYWGYNEGAYNPYLEHAIVKTVAGFLNRDGGDLLIGVDDDGNVLGLENDYTARGGRQSRDAYQRSLEALLERDLGADALRHLTVRFPRVDGGEVCRVTVAPAPRPFITRRAGDARLYVRDGDCTRKLTGADALDFMAARWGDPPGDARRVFEAQAEADAVAGATSPDA